MGGVDGGSYIARCTKMRELKRDRQANSSFLYHRYIYPYMYTYMSEEGKQWMFFTFSHIPLTLYICRKRKKKRDECFG
jgi:hypothetical protein